jgi:hypothetical protein
MGWLVRMRVLISAIVAVPCLILLLPAFAAAGALWLFASSVRALGRLLEPSYVPWPELMEFDGTLGWRPRSNVDARYLAEGDDVFRAVTDHEGWPGTHALDDSSVVVIGDSFAFGYGVDAGRSFADLNPRIAIKAIGAPGYSMVQSVLLMEQFGHRLAEKLVVWFVCLENDLQDNLLPNMRRYRAPFVRRSHVNGEWEIVTDHVSREAWECSDWRVIQRTLPNLCVPGPLADRTFSGADYLIGRAAANCRRIGARLVLVTIPVTSQLTANGHATLARLSGNPGLTDARLPDRRIAESCDRYGVPLVSGIDHLSARDYKRLEGLHWTGRGHRRMADLLGRLYESFTSDALAAPESSGPAAPEQRFATHERARVQA